jgi:hypothetical protein
MPVSEGGAPVIAEMWADGVSDGVTSIARPARIPRSAKAAKPPARSFPPARSRFNRTPPTPSREIRTAREDSGPAVAGARPEKHERSEKRRTTAPPVRAALLVTAVPERCRRKSGFPRFVLVASATRSIELSKTIE